MSSRPRPRPAPEWLSSFQSSFSDAIRLPLDRRSGTLRAKTQDYEAGCIERLGRGEQAEKVARARLAVYNRQYWFRLFTTLQTEFPLTAALTGAWSFNELAARFLRRHPPRHHDLARVADGFERFVADEVPASGFVRPPGFGPVPRDAMCEVTQIDAAFRRCFWAPFQAPFVPKPEDVALIERFGLVPVESLSIVDEHRPWVQIRNDLVVAQDGPPLALPDNYVEGPRSWLFVATKAGRRVVLLEAPRAQLLRDLCEGGLAAALARLQAKLGDRALEPILLRTREWMAKSVEWGCWARCRRPDESSS